MKIAEKSITNNTIFISLLSAVAKGEQDKAEALISKHPELLRLKGKIHSDYSGRIIYGTALQIALGADDVSFSSDCESMAEMIERHLLKLPGGEAEIKKQIKAQFPTDLIIRQAEHHRKDLFALQAVMKAFLECRHQAALEKVIDKFKHYLDQQAKKPIHEGRHFNSALLKTAIAFYAQHYNELEIERTRLFWTNVIGYLQRFLPANYGQAFSQRLDYLVMREEALHRKLGLRYSEKIAFFPLDLNKNYRLGYDYAIYNGAPSTDPVKNSKNLEHIVYNISLFIRLKEQALVSFINSYLIG